MERTEWAERKEWAEWAERAEWTEWEEWAEMAEWAENAECAENTKWAERVEWVERAENLKWAEKSEMGGNGGNLRDSGYVWKPETLLTKFLADIHDIFQVERMGSIDRPGSTFGIDRGSPECRKRECIKSLVHKMSVFSVNTI